MQKPYIVKNCFSSMRLKKWNKFFRGHIMLHAYIREKYAKIIWLPKFISHILIIFSVLFTNRNVPYIRRTDHSGILSMSSLFFCFYTYYPLCWIISHLPYCIWMMCLPFNFVFLGLGVLTSRKYVHPTSVWGRYYPLWKTRFRKINCLPKVIQVVQNINHLSIK